MVDSSFNKKHVPKKLLEIQLCNREMCEVFLKDKAVNACSRNSFPWEGLGSVAAQQAFWQFDRPAGYPNFPIGNEL